MTVELAKKLKEAGFPQKGKSAAAYSPTLSELIAACEKHFWTLRHAPDEKWIATGRIATKENNIPYYESAPYDEPDIAVAELYLAIKLHGAGGK